SMSVHARAAFWQIATGRPAGSLARLDKTTHNAAAAAAERRAAAIIAVVAQIPRGRVTTYGSVAARAGLPRQARLVGKVLASLPPRSKVPWQRVVAAGGRIAFPDGSPSRARQVRLLRAEGIDATRGRVDLKRHGWGAPDGGDLDRWLWSRDGE
ncbi:MAG TPA: MGMT family protein, partial [Steroidobacteraceae bacterium]